MASSVREAAFRTEAFDLGEDLFDRIEVGRVFGKKREASAGSCCWLSARLFLCKLGVEDDDVVGLEGLGSETARHRRESSSPLIGPSNTQGASMRSLRKAARKVAVFHLPCGTLSTRRSPRDPAVEPCHVGLGQVSSMNTSRETSARFWRLRQRALWRVMSAIPLARGERLFLCVTPRRRKKRHHHRGVGFDPALDQQPVAKRLKRDVGFIASQRFEKFSMRLEFRTEVSAHSARRARTAPLEALHPFDCRRFAHPKPRRGTTRRLIPPRITVSITRSRKSCEYAEAIPAGLRPASRLNQNTPDSGIPRRFKLAAARSSNLSAMETTYL